MSIQMGAGPQQTVMLSPWQNRRYGHATPGPDQFGAPVMPADVAAVEAAQRRGLYRHLSPERIAKWKLQAQRTALLADVPITTNESRSMQMASARQAADRVRARAAAGGRY